MKKRSYAQNIATMTKEQYEETLHELSLDRKKFAHALGVSYPTVRSWHTNKDMPMYAQKFLEVALELQKYKNICVDVKSLYKNIDSINKSLKDL